jgi:general secretion pathway protein G
MRAVVRRLNQADGFTLIELMVAMLIIAVLATLAVPSFVGSLRAARESQLRSDLHIMRVAIDNYTADKAKAPQSLDDLVSTGYLQKIPVDPMTHSSDTWVTDSDSSLRSINQTDPGMVDVHSGADGVGSDGEPYSSW